MPDSADTGAPDPLSSPTQSLSTVAPVVQQVTGGNPPATEIAMDAAGKSDSNVFSDFAASIAKVSAQIGAAFNAGKAAGANPAAIANTAQDLGQAQATANMLAGQAQANITYSDATKKADQATATAARAVQLGLNQGSTQEIADASESATAAANVSAQVQKLQDMRKVGFFDNPAEYLINHIINIPLAESRTRDSLSELDSIQSSVADRTKELSAGSLADAAINSVDTTNRAAQLYKAAMATAVANGVEPLIKAQQISLGAYDLGVRQGELSVSQGNLAVRQGELSATQARLAMDQAEQPLRMKTMQLGLDTGTFKLGQDMALAPGIAAEQQQTLAKNAFLIKQNQALGPGELMNQALGIARQQFELTQAQDLAAGIKTKQQLTNEREAFELKQAQDLAEGTKTLQSLQVARQQFELKQSQDLAAGVKTRQELDNERAAFELEQSKKLAPGSLAEQASRLQLMDLNKGYYSAIKESILFDRDSKAALRAEEIEKMVRNKQVNEETIGAVNRTLQYFGGSGNITDLSKIPEENRPALLRMTANLENYGRVAATPAAAYETIRASGLPLNGIPASHLVTVNAIGQLYSQKQLQALSAGPYNAPLKGDALKEYVYQGVNNSIANEQYNIAPGNKIFTPPSLTATLDKDWAKNNPVLQALRPLTVDRDGKSLPRDLDGTSLLNSAVNLINQKKLTETQAASWLQDAGKNMIHDMQEAGGFARFSIPVSEHFVMQARLPGLNLTGTHIPLDLLNTTSILTALRTQRVATQPVPLELMPFN